MLTLVLAYVTLHAGISPRCHIVKAAHLGARVYDLHPREAPQCHALSHDAIGG